MNIQNPKALRKDAAYSDLVMQAAQLHLRGRLEDAETIYEAVLKARPNHFDARQLLGNLRFRQERFAEAEILLRRAVTINGSVAPVHLSLGKTLAALNRHADALKSFDRAIALEPAMWEAHHMRGVSLLDLDRLDESVVSFRATLDIKPDCVDALVNMAFAFSRLSRFVESERYLEEALTLAPDYAHARHNHGILTLLTGDFQSGWEGYEYRLSVDVMSQLPLGAAVPVWNGEDVDGKTILVAEEQGAGDIIQFFRYLILLAARGAKVTFLVRENFHGLLAKEAEIIRTIAEPDDGTYDYQIMLMSLPRAFRTTLETIPPVVHYMQSDPSLVRRWGAVVDGQGLKVGIAWQGNAAGKVDIGRSVPLKCFASLAAVPGVRLISLQKGYGTEQLERLPRGMHVETLGTDFDSGPDAFIDTVAVMANLDLVITSDTSIAHLAATVGRPTWVALKHVPDWRWMLDRPDSPWYPTMRLYRQTSRGDWDGVFEAMATDLAARSM